VPLEPTSPESKDVPTTESKSITHFHVVQLKIDLDPNDQSAVGVEVRWQEGYMDGDAFVGVSTKVEHLAGQDVLDKINETTDGTTSVYNNVKQRVWSLLQTRGLAPAGDIT